MTIPKRYANEFIAAGHAYHIPPEVLAGVAQIETGMGANLGPSSAGARGFMQFMPATAAALGIDPLDDRQAIWGAAKLLNQYGYQKDPFKALASYNAGPGNWAAGKGYATKVQAAARGFAAELTGSSSSRPPATTAAPAPASGGGDTFAHQLATLALQAALVAAGSTLAYIGARHTLSPTKAPA